MDIAFRAMKGGYVYIITNKWNTVLYTGVTSDLCTRIMKHIEKCHPGSFTAKYQVNKLVYYKWFPTIEEAIAEEKRIKGASRKRKIKLVESSNPGWEDMLPRLLANPPHLPSNN